MTRDNAPQKPTGYDRYVNWKLFSIPLVLFTLLMIMPTPDSMLQVGIEYSLGSEYEKTYLANELFNNEFDELTQWQMYLVQLMVASESKSSYSKKAFLKRNLKWAHTNDVKLSPGQLQIIKEHIKTIEAKKFETLLSRAHDIKTKGIKYDQLTPAEKKKADRAGFHVKAAIATVAFVVLCFLTEAIPLPMVAFCIGLIAICTGIVTRKTVASLYWSDATWFIMGSLMFATAFVKTGVDRRIALMMFGKLKSPSLKSVTLIIILIISPLTMFMSDHALAAMFLPIGIVLYKTSTAATGKDDPELAKMLMITIAMACNLGGSLSPSGAARNIIMMSYTEDMFGISMGFGQWMIYCVPLLLFTIPVTWAVINWRFKPAITDLGPSISIVKNEVTKDGNGWTGTQKVSVGIFLVMLFCWITEKNLILELTGIRFGIGVIAVMGALAYVLAGIVNWRDYQTKVDWGVVWLYAGAIIFGRILIQTGGAYWLAKSIVQWTIPLGLGEGYGLLLSGNIITGLLTQLMADGPACAAVGPVTLAMAGLVHPGTSIIPFTAMSTSIASSLAYCLVIGTPPNAIVYASGYLEPKDYLRAGAILWFTNMGALLFISFTYWRWLGWPGLPGF